jgi:hypothetical protein
LLAQHDGPAVARIAITGPCHHSGGTTMTATRETTRPEHQEQWLAARMLCQAAVVRQLLIPAPDRQAVAWKRRMAKRWRFTGEEGAEVAAAIAADEQWFYEHRLRRSLFKPFRLEWCHHFYPTSL